MEPEPVEALPNGALMVGIYFIKWMGLAESKLTLMTKPILLDNA
jgi:hypothetical protein